MLDAVLSFESNFVAVAIDPISGDQTSLDDQFLTVKLRISSVGLPSDCAAVSFRVNVKQEINKQLKWKFIVFDFDKIGWRWTAVTPFPIIQYNTLLTCINVPMYN